MVKDGVIEEYAISVRSRPIFYIEPISTGPSEIGMKNYPSVTELLKAKAQRRKRLARLSFEEKIAIVNKWRKLTLSIRKSQAAAKPQVTR